MGGEISWEDLKKLNLADRRRVTREKVELLVDDWVRKLVVKPGVRFEARYDDFEELKRRIVEFVDGGMI
jgi:hypothetical protein